MPKNILRLAAPACLGLSVAAWPTIASADTAPSGIASATGAQVGGLLALSDTQAQAGPSGTGSDAAVVSVGGEPLLGLGGSSAAGPSDGSLIDLGGPAGVTVQAAPWEATAGTTDGGTSSASQAAVARAAVPSTVEAHVVESESAATHTETRSTGAAVSNGARLGLLDMLRLTVLHAEVSSSGEGSSHLVGINDTEIGSDEQLNGVCSLALNPVANILCLTATGGLGSDGEDVTGAAGIADVDSALLTDLLGGVGADAMPLAAFAATGGTGSGTSPVLGAPDVGATGLAQVIEAPRGAVDAAESTAGIDSALARTGGSAIELVPWGIATLGLGAGLRLLTARRRALV